MMRFKHLIFASVLGVSTMAMNGCDAIYWDESSSLEVVNSKPEITVLTLKNPLIYSTDKTGHKFGIDHDLLESFADHYNLKIKFIPVANEVEMKKALAEGMGDIAAARLPTPIQNNGFLVGPTYEETFLSLFCNSKSQVANIVDLKDKTVAILSKDNIYGLSERLAQMAPQTKIQIVTAASPKTLFENMARKDIDCVMAENLEGQFFARYYNNVEKITALTDHYSLSWLVRPDLADVNRLLQAWFQKASRNDEIMRVHDRYKLYLSELNRHDVLYFMKQTRKTLPEFEREFRNAAREHRLPWQLIAAVSYQESQWDNEAVSYTGVRGLMQLTKDTADHLGLEDRTDPVQSIWGGSKYLRYLLNKTPSYLNYKDRLYLALAAYNIGYGHLLDAQKLVQKRGKNPYSWRHLREVLPLLEDPSYETQLEYGFARGTETVEFVERVTSFYNLMVATQP
ncbi:membrane-bound lytic murein transglycosylase MltF [Bdellovibrio sp. HCB337]|uniref:membrane-bound lytic murein transglycosylase MltF n=1 Tax=Bdellovibrio sp. HCB337 TaxID=3394358 RepID=UPI0039A5F99F